MSDERGNGSSTGPDYFALLGLPRDYVLDPEQLESAYFAAQRQYHPDRWVHRSTSEQALAATRSSAINAAYRTLQSPLARARYLLACQGVDLATARPDPETLMEVMALQEAQAEGYSSEVASLIADAETALREAFTQARLEDAKQVVLRLSYLYKCLPDRKEESA